MNGDSGPAIELVEVCKDYGSVRAVDNVDLAIAEGEFVVLLGPSGCGKSTLLKLIAGLEDVSNGEIYIGGRLANYLRPGDRDVAMVFQNYALYPHMTVRKNLGFPLRRRGKAKDFVTDRVAFAAGLLELDQQLDRYPDELSGGQRQRVALGRAIVREPYAFLMDEPLSNLDALLRVQMRTELLRLHRRVGPDDDLRDPRPDRGDDDGGLARRHARWGRTAGRPPRRRVQPADQHLSWRRSSARAR